MITIITPTWDWDRTLAQITKHRELSKPLDHINIVVWSGAPVDEPDETSEMEAVIGAAVREVKVESDLQGLKLAVCKQHLPPVTAMYVGAQMALHHNPTNLLMFLHDDVEILQPGWEVGIERFFASRPFVGLAGFGGATGLGRDDIYKADYELQQLIRIGYASNADDWFDHGALLIGPRRVAVIDGLCMIFRPQAYLSIGGWLPCVRDSRIPFHMYDAWACLKMAQTKRWQTWALPIKFHHQGGGTSVKFGEEYESMVKGLGFESGQALFEFAHKSIYVQFQDVLPLRV